MLLGLVSLVAALFAALVFVVLVVTGGPWVWAATAVGTAYLGRRVWRWLD